MNWRRRHDFPTPRDRDKGTGVTDDDEFEHVGEGHVWDCIIIDGNKYQQIRGILEWSWETVDLTENADDFIKKNNM